MKLRTSVFLLLIGSAFLMLLAACDINVNAPAAPTPTATVTAQATAPGTPTPNPATTDISAPTPTALPAGDTPTLAATDTIAPTIAAESNTNTAAPNQTPTGQAAALPTPSGTIVDAVSGTAPPTRAGNAPSPTVVVATSSGEAITAMQALAALKPKALSSYPDARLALLVNSKPGQQKSLLGSSLGDPSISEPTPGGKGRNWTLIVVSPAGKGAMAFSMDGTTVDLVKEGAVTNDLLAQFSTPASAALDLSKLDPSTMKDSDAIAQAAGDRGSTQQIGVALLAPDGLGVGPLPTPAAGGSPPQLAYELFSTDPTKQVFIFFDALTGKVVLDSGT